MVWVFVPGAGRKARRVDCVFVVGEVSECRGCDDDERRVRKLGGSVVGGGGNDDGSEFSCVLVLGGCWVVGVLVLGSKPWMRG